jgi:hypothetical protein
MSEPKPSFEVMRVWAVVVDYGLNGAASLGVFSREPTREEVVALEKENFAGCSYGPRSVTGFSGITIEEHEVRP